MFELIFVIVKDNCLPTYFENNIHAILKSSSNLFMGRQVAGQKNSISSLLLTSVFCQCLSWLTLITFLVITTNVTALKSFIVSISISSDHRDGRTVSFSFCLNNQTSLYRWFYLIMRWTSKVLFFSHLVVAFNKLSNFNSWVFIPDFT